MKRILSLIILSLLFISSYAQTDTTAEELVTMYREGRYWGVINIKGEVLVEPKYSKGFSFKDGYAKVSLFKFIDKKGNVIDVKKHLRGIVEVGQFSDGLLMVKTAGKFGYMDTAGDLVIPAIYKMATEFNNGFALVENKNECFVIDKKGNEKKVATEKKVSEVRNFSDGLAAVMTGGRTNNRFGYINEEGVVVIKPQYVYCGDFINGIAWVVTEDGKNGFINKKGDWAVESIFIRVKDMDPVSGLARVRDKNGWGYTNVKGEILRPEGMEKFRDFSEGLCQKRIDKKWGYMNNKGEVVIEPIFDSKSQFGKKLRKVSFDPSFSFSVSALGGFGYSNARLKSTMALFKDIENDGATPFKNGLANVRLNGRWGVINKKGEWVLPPTYEWLMPFGELE